MKICRSAIAASVLLACPLPAVAQDDMGFDIEITLSRKAAAKLVADNEEIVVLASYYGEPKQGAEGHANEAGLIDLSPEDESVEISGSGGSAYISGKAVDANRIEWLAGPVMVNVNVFSARRSDSDNVLSCDFVDGPLRDIQRQPVALHCGLIEENLDTKLRP